MGSIRAKAENVAAYNKKYKQKHNDDGTINKDAIGPREIPGKGTKSRTFVRRKADAKREHGNKQRAQRGRAKADQRQASQASAPAGVQFAPYTDHVRKAKDAASKKLKDKQKRSYYED